MRTYLVFGSNDQGRTFVPIGEFEAADHEGAQRLAAKDEYSFEAFGSTPANNWTFGKVSSRVVYDYEELTMPGGVEDDQGFQPLPDQDERAEKLAEARGALSE